MKLVTWQRWVLTVNFILAGSATLARAEGPATQPATQPAAAPINVEVKDAQALKSAMGKTIAIEGVVTEAIWSSGGKVLRIKFEGNDKTHFQGIIFQADRAAFDKDYGGDVAKALTGATVHMEGPLTPYRTEREIIVKAASQLRIVKPAVARAADEKK